MDTGLQTRGEFLKTLGLIIGGGALAMSEISCGGDDNKGGGNIEPKKDSSAITLKLVAGGGSYLPFTAIQNANNPANDAKGYGYYPNIIINQGSFKIVTNIESVDAPIANTAVPNENLKTHFQIHYDINNIKENGLQNVLNVNDTSVPLAVIKPVEGIKSLYHDANWDVTKIEIYASEAGVSTLHPNTNGPTVKPEHTSKKALANAVTNFDKPPFPMQQALTFTGTPTDLPPTARVGVTLG